MSEQSIKSYNNPERAIDYTTKKGFDPKRKDAMLNVTLEILTDLLPKGSSILELGAGSGLFTRKMIDAGHFNEIIVSDGAQSMLEIARTNLSSNSTKLVFDTLDFTQTSWSKEYKKNKIDAVTSSMALHHAMDKKTLFNEVYNSLSPNGVFVFADHMAGSSNLIDKLIGTKRAKIKLNSCSEKNKDTFKLEEFLKDDKEKQDSEGNKCESISKYLQYLQEVGFKDGDCLWRDYWLAVFVARKR